MVGGQFAPASMVNLNWPEVVNLTGVSTLWQVDDAATQEFMELFYSNLVNSNSIEKAMIQARLKLKEKYPDPYYWGTFEYIR